MGRTGLRPDPSERRKKIHVRPKCRWTDYIQKEKTMEKTIYHNDKYGRGEKNRKTVTKFF